MVLIADGSLILVFQLIVILYSTVFYCVLLYLLKAQEMYTLIDKITFITHDITVSSIKRSKDESEIVGHTS